MVLTPAISNNVLHPDPLALDRNIKLYWFVLKVSCTGFLNLIVTHDCSLHFNEPYIAKGHCSLVPVSRPSKLYICEAVFTRYARTGNVTIPIRKIL